IVPSNVEISIYMLIGFIIGVVFHQFMHGYVAYRMGDTTAKRAGRLTLDPLAHVDPFGTIILPGMLFLFSIMGYRTFIIGYAKPVPLNPFPFRKPRAIIWVSLAGPLTNLAIGVVFIGLMKILTLFGGGTTLTRINYTCLYIAYINIILLVFNLIPIPPLDGSRVVAYYLRGEAQRIYQSIEPFGFFIILILVMVLNFPLSGIAKPLLNFLLRI